MDKVVINESILRECFYAAETDTGQEVLEVNLSNWHSHLTEDMLISNTTNASMISFVLEDPGPIRIEVLDWLAKHVASKIVKVSFVSCPELSWKQIKRVLDASYSVCWLCLKKNPWVVDSVIEQMSIKFAKCLQFVDVENTKVTDNALFHLGKRCFNIKSLRLECCPNITNAGVVELSRRIHLSSIHISHNLYIDDSSIVQLLSNSNYLSSLKLSNCPNLTDNSMIVLQEALSAWGKKKNSKSSQLQYLEFTENENLTSRGVFAMSAASQCIISLNIQNCRNIDWVEAIDYIKSLVSLRELKIGSDNSSYSMSFIHKRDCLNNLIPVLPRLVSLHLNSLIEFEDGDIAEILDHCDDLLELNINNMQFGTQCSESLCSNIPNIGRLIIKGSEVFTDPALRCITTVCLNLVELRVQSCQQITDDGLSRCAYLRSLNILDVSGNEFVYGTFLKCVATCPIEHLIADNAENFKLLPDALKLSPLTKKSLRTLSMKECNLVDELDIAFLLETLLLCYSIDITGCSLLGNANKLANIPNFNPFLRLIMDGKLVSGINDKYGEIDLSTAAYDYYSKGFCGFRAVGVHRVSMVQHKAIQTGLRHHYAARVIVKAIRVYVERMKILAGRRRYVAPKKTRLTVRVNGLVNKTNAVIIMQSVIRQFICRRSAKKMLRAAKILTRNLQICLDYQMQFKIRKAIRFFRKKLQRMCYSAILDFTQVSKSKLWKLREAVEARCRYYLKKRAFKKIKKYEFVDDVLSPMLKARFLKLPVEGSDIQETNPTRYSKIARKHEIHVMRIIVRYWRTVIFETMRNNLKLNLIFVNCIPLEFYNSRRQIAHKERAVEFWSRRIMVPAWMAFCDDYYRAQRANKLEPMAIEHFKFTFFERVLRATFASLKWYRTNRQLKVAARERGDLCYSRRKFDVFVLKSKRKLQRKARLQIICNRNTANNFSKNAITALTERFPRNAELRKYYRSLYERVSIFRYNYLIEVSTTSWLKFAKKSIIYRYQNEKATEVATLRLMQRKYSSWKKFVDYRHNINKYVRKYYRDTLMRKMLVNLRKHAESSKRQRELMEIAVQGKLGEDAQAVSDKFMRGVSVMQAIIRGIRCRKVHYELRMQQLYSIRLIQNAVRRGLAYKAFRRRFRMRELEETLAQENERRLMKQNEAETLFYWYVMGAATGFQRLIRGFLGRKRFLRLATTSAVEKGKAFYESNKNLRRRHENFILAEVAKQKLRQKHAVTIQKVARGFIQRRRYHKLKKMGIVGKYALKCQTWFRRKLSLMKLYAEKRNKSGDLRFRAARRQRGHLLRSIGFTKRRSQSYLAQFLTTLGIDPITYNYRLNEMYQMIESDFKYVVDGVKREYELYNTYSGNKNLIVPARRKIIASLGYKFEVNDSVRIVDPFHEFYGYMGKIVRIDPFVPGLPLFEIKLDKIDRQVYVKMSIDPLVHFNNQQALGKIEKVPRLMGFRQDHVVYGLDALTESFEKISWFKKVKICLSSGFQTSIFFGDEPPDVYTYVRQEDRNPVNAEDYVNAIWTIQRAFRCYRARKIVARRRFERWSRAAHAQWALYDQMSDTNTLSQLTYAMAGFVNARYYTNILFDVILHRFIPSRLVSSVKKLNEKNVVNSEIDFKYWNRMEYLGKFSKDKDREVFITGYERLSTFRKMRYSVRALFGHVKSKTIGLADVVGRRGTRLLAKKENMITGTDFYTFEQFLNSPHVRYGKGALYQGEWAGIPFFTPLNPHGKGLISFLDGWGFSREDKSIQLTIVKCTNLVASDGLTSDPFCDIFCNGRNVQSSIKWSNLNPEYYETFELDVTNPDASVQIVVKDKDFFGADDFLGMIELPVSRYEDGKEHFEKFCLTDMFGLRLQDRGEIYVRVKWGVKIYATDLTNQKLRWFGAIKIQAWARMIHGKEVLRKLRLERNDFLKHVHACALKMTSVARRRLAVKEMKRLKRRKKACIKIQKRIRIYLAKRETKRRRFKWQKAIIIQNLARSFLAKMRIERIKERKLRMLNTAATTIQAYGRRLIVRCREFRRKLALRNMPDYVPPVPVPVSEWIDTYGRDPEYGTRRTRRSYEVVFARMLKKKYCRLKGRFGEVFVDQYPPSALEKSSLDGDELTVRDQFVSVFVPAIWTKYLHKHQVVESIQDTPYSAIVHIATSMNIRASVDSMAIMIQCCMRVKFARKEWDKMIRVRNCIIKFQRIFRQRNDNQHKASFIISAFFRRISSIVYVKRLKLETNAARKIQSGVRFYQARCKVFDLRCVQPDQASILRCSSFVEGFGPEKILDLKANSFWLAQSRIKAEVRVELKKRMPVSEIWIMTSMRQASPQFVTISVVTDKLSKKYDMLFSDFPLPLNLNGCIWRKIVLTKTAVAKFFKFEFAANYGDVTNIGVRQIRFLLAKEKSACVKVEPDDIVLNNVGPILGKEMAVSLKAECDGWPPPTFQWYRNGKVIPGATSETLYLTLRCAVSPKFRTYRCAKCKMFSLSVPDNCFHIVCGNCSIHFNFREAEQFSVPLRDIHDQEDQERKELQAYKNSYEELKNSKDAKVQESVAHCKLKIAEIEANLRSLLLKRYQVKASLETVNRFEGEGIYHCLVQNVRGGSFVMLRKTREVVVVVEEPLRYRVKVGPHYARRGVAIRRKWTIYSTILGTFLRGKLVGLVTIRFKDGSFYEGPYVGEEWLDRMGKVMEGGRIKDHYGIFVCEDGRKFEGPNVCNHFDPFNLQTFYRCTLANGEVYEGMFCDEMFHGTGVYNYNSGSVYEGAWYKGLRFGHGHYRASASEGGWTYEGEWDADRRHGEGSISWADGSCYIGEWFYDKQQGNGVFISKLRDVYKGEFWDGSFNGRGELLYADGSKYIGYFKEGMRHGKGILCERSGQEIYGHFVNDKLDGEVIIKTIIPIEVPGQNNFEVRVALYRLGEFIEYKSKYSNPVATKQFVKLFRENRAMFDSVYAMIVAKAYPDIPHGLDDRNEDVVLILEKIRNEAGLLVGREALLRAQERYKTVLEKFLSIKSLIEDKRYELDRLGVRNVELEENKRVLKREYNRTIFIVEAETKKIEQFWIDEPSGARNKFRAACKKLSTVSKDHYFKFKNHGTPPPFVAKIADCVAILLKEDESVGNWKKQQMIFSDNIYNARFHDEMALRVNYDCKLDFLMNGSAASFDIFDYMPVLKSTHIDQFKLILTDTRFRRDSYFVEACGTAGPVLVEWIFSMYKFVRAANSVYSMLESGSLNRIKASRIMNNIKEVEKETAEIASRIDAIKEEFTSKFKDYQELEDACGKSKNVLEFVEDSFKFKGKHVKRDDYYEIFERKIEEQRDFLDIEAAVQVIVTSVENKIAQEKKKVMIDALARGKDYVEEVLVAQNLLSMITEEVKFQQNQLIGDGECVGYTVDPQEPCISGERAKAMIASIANTVINALNASFHEKANARSWLSLKGKVILPRFLYITVWKVWKDTAVARERIRAANTWEEIFGPDKSVCARRAIEARVNVRMSEVARAQAKIWTELNPVEAKEMEKIFSEEFLQMYPEGTAENALYLIEDDSGGTKPEDKAAAAAWVRLNPQLFDACKDARAQAMSQEFALKFTSNPGVQAFKIINGLLAPGAAEYEYRVHADHWVSYHMEDYDKSTEEVVSTLARKFSDKHPTNTAEEAASIIFKDEISNFIEDETVKVEYKQDTELYICARCWSFVNQGLVRKANINLMKENVGNMNRMWAELADVTESFQKGSYLHLPEQWKYNTTLDRFCGFRERLLGKYAFLYGFICHRVYEIWNELERLELEDPNTKKFHNIRPSEEVNVVKKILDKHERDKKDNNKEYAEACKKLSIWHNYFGQASEREWYANNTDPNV